MRRFGKGGNEKSGVLGLEFGLWQQKIIRSLGFVGLARLPGSCQCHNLLFLLGEL